MRSTITSFNGSSFSFLAGFGTFHSVNISYYISDSGSAIVYKLSDTWEYVAQNYFPSPKMILAISNNLYISAESNIFKTDNNLNVLSQYNASDTFYQGFYYNPADNLIYVASSLSNAIHVFDLNLSFNSSISTSTYSPFSIAGYNSQLYVGTETGLIVVIVNRTILTSFDGCLGSSNIIRSILFDQFGYFASTCEDSNKLYLYTSNGTYTGKSLETPFYAEFIQFDSVGRFVLLSALEISIYY